MVLLCLCSIYCVNVPKHYSSVVHVQYFTAVRVQYCAAGPVQSVRLVSLISIVLLVQYCADVPQINPVLL